MMQLFPQHQARRTLPREFAALRIVLCSKYLHRLLHVPYEGSHAHFFVAVVEAAYGLQQVVHLLVVHHGDHR